MSEIKKNGQWRKITQKHDRGYSWLIDSVFPDVETMEHYFKKAELPFRINNNGDFVAQTLALQLAEHIFENEQ